MFKEAIPEAVLDPAKNIIPDRVHHIHLTAVGGTGMGALAGLLKDMGYQVSGSDANVYPPMSTFLQAKGIVVSEGFGAQNLHPPPDLVVVGNVITRLNPEAVALARLGLPYCSMPQAVNHFVADGKQRLLVAGTHGKTTTAAAIAWLLQAADGDPSFLIGGILQNFNSSCRLGRGPHIVLEADEYDTAFFDKGAKFFHYPATMAVLTSVEFDHADIFADLAAVKRTFARFVKQMPANALLIAVDNDANVDAVLAEAACRVVRYGRRAGSAWRLGWIERQPPWTRFEVLRHERRFGVFKTGLLGRHNLYNLTAAIAVAASSGIDADRIGRALEGFQGARRRQEIRGCRRGVTVIDDFAHHPTAVKATIQAVKAACAAGRLIAVFEPRTNTSMRRIFQSVYPACFDAADVVCIRQPSRLDKILPDQRFCASQLVADLRRRGIAAHFFEDTDGIIDFVIQRAQSGDMVLVMSNGGFDNIHARLLERL